MFLFWSYCCFKEVENSDCAQTIDKCIAEDFDVELDTVLKSGLSKFCGRVFKSRTYLCVSRQYPLKFFKGCLPQNLLSPLLNTLSQIILILEPKYSRSSRLQMFYKVSILKNLAKFTRKHLCWRHFLIKMWAQRPATSLENDSDTGLFL